jgi:hypothetical protein
LAETDGPRKRFILMPKAHSQQDRSLPETR